ncbi:hypothetical protein I8920_09485 [Curtobacterium sp. YC1]|uniref:hypothetical protein n=1 Tax=Curtobacterium sp. YC1 TaxID=2795488 RepID=UPI0018E54132|nr:hypothetical protein [Curtobacterium sp. YC1]QQD75100.1 hypothetical protein I8920_09485 [Curtobacterium sp. YC1]
MAAFIAGDQPVADFDYDKPDELPQQGTTSLEVVGQTLPTEQTVDAFVGSWSDLTLPEVGTYKVFGVVTKDGRSQRSLVDTLVVVDPDDEWHNVITARLEWDGAPDQDGTLQRLLSVARDQVEAYAPELPDGAAIPERYRAGQLMQARNTFNASITNGDNSVDLGGGLVISPRPLDWAVKQLLRPARAKKAVG